MTQATGARGSASPKPPLLQIRTRNAPELALLTLHTLLGTSEDAASLQKYQKTEGSAKYTRSLSK